MKLEHLTAKITGWSQSNPTDIAVTHGADHITYLELEKAANRAANFFYEQYRGKKIIELNPRAVIILDRSPAFITILIALLKCGLIFVPIDSGLPESRIRLLIDETEPGWLITTGEYQKKFRDIIDHEKKNMRVLLIDGRTGEIEAGNGEALPVELMFEKITNKFSYIYFTSGSTGTPKGVMGRHKSLSHFIEWEITEFGIDRNSRVSQLTSPSFDAVLRDIFVPLCAGGRCCIPETGVLMNPALLLDWLDREQVNVIHSVPSFFKTLLPEIEDDRSLPGLKLSFLSGELLRGRDIKRFIEIFQERIQLVNFYGPTETTMIKLFYKIKKEDADKPIIPVGKAMTGAQVMILDGEMRKCLTGNVGEIYIRTPYTTAGYFNDREANKSVFLKNPFSDNPKDLIYKTGDLGRLLPDGNVEVTGRMDDQVKIRGVRVELGEIENALLRHEEIKEAVVTFRENDDGEHYLCSYFIGIRDQGLGIREKHEPRLVETQHLASQPFENQERSGEPCVSPDELREYLTQLLPGYMIPSYFVECAEMPLKPNGKIDKQALPDPVSKNEISSERLPPRNDIESGLVAIWSDILSLEEEGIGIDDDFFSHGGHSLRGMNMISRIKKEFGSDISLRTIFKELTIKNIAQHIGSSKESIYSSILPVEKKEYYELSSAQKRLFFVHMMEDDKTASYNMRRVVQIEGKLDKTSLKQAFFTLLQRHESLRTSFFIANEIPVQRVHDFEDVVFDIEYHDIGERQKQHPSAPIIQDIIKEFGRSFDLSRPPMLRAGLIHTSAGYILMVEMHHIISDGTSMNALVEEFMRHYSGEEPALLQLSYKDFSSWQNRLFTGGKIKAQEDYWLDLLADAEGIPRLNLPTDFERPEIYSFAGDSYGFSLQEEVAEGLKRMNLDCGVTLYMNLLTIMNVLFYKYTGQEDIIIGSGDAGRHHPDLQGIIGMFVNTRGMRNFPGGEKTYSQFLQEVRENCLKAFENKDAQFETIVEKLELERDSSRCNPLFDVFLAVQNYEAPHIEEEHFRETSFRYGDSGHLISKFDMTFYVMEFGSNIHFSIEYSTALFKRATIEGIAGHFIEIIEQAVQDREKQLKDFTISHDFAAVSSPVVDDYEEDFGF